MRNSNALHARTFRGWVTVPLMMADGVYVCPACPAGSAWLRTATEVSSSSVSAPSPPSTLPAVLTSASTKLHTSLQFSPANPEMPGFCFTLRFTTKHDQSIFQFYPLDWYFYADSWNPNVKLQLLTGARFRIHFVRFRFISRPKIFGTKGGGRRMVQSFLKHCASIICIRFIYVKEITRNLFMLK